MCVHFTSEQVSQAIMNAGIELRPEDCSTIKFWQIAEELGYIARQQMRIELNQFSADVLWEMSKKSV